jgi:hypothetical protein
MRQGQTNHEPKPSMVRHRNKNHRDLALGFVGKGAARVAEQKQLIARLKERGKPTKQAEEVLKEFEATLLALRNHRKLMQDLMEPSRREKSRTPHDDT